MAQAKSPSSAPPWPAEGLPIDVAFERIAKPLWDAYLAAPRQLTIIVLGGPPGHTTDAERDLARHSKAQAALDALLRELVSPPGGFELWARAGSRMADLKLVPASQIGDLEADYVQRTARWVGDSSPEPSLYDLHLRQVGGPARTAAPVAVEPLTLMEPKDWYAAAREDYPRHKRERLGDYAKRLHDLMQDAPVKKVWLLETLRRRLYDKPE